MSLNLHPDCVLETKRLVLEPLLPEHASALFPGLSDSSLYTWIPKEPPVSCHMLKKRYARLRSRRAPDGDQLWLNWACRLVSDAKYVGVAEVTILPDGTAWLAYFVFTGSQRMGFANEFCTSVIRYLYEVYRLSSVVLFVDTRNQPSIRLAESLGFLRREVIVDADFFGGRSSDEYRYEHLNPDQ